jgi:transcriptional regulator of arginine metabolism
MNNNPTSHALRRRAEILRLVRGRAVRSQEELRRLLRRRGFPAAQPTLSRDVQDLGLARTPTGYTPPPDPARFVPGARRERALDRVLGQGVLSVQAAGTLVVIRTPAAAADSVARAVDEATLPGVLGSIAGDDTVFVATIHAAAARRVARRLGAPLGAVTRRRRAGG